VLLVVRYALIKLHLVGLAASAGQLTDADVVEAIHIFQRAVDHDPNFLPHVLDLLRDNDVTSMAFMAVLIVS
jgi:lysine-N-methylase